MKVHHVGSNGVAVYIEAVELKEYCREGGELDEPHARQLALHALRELGVNVRGAMEIEAYTGQGVAMVFAVLAAQDEPADAAAYFAFVDMNSALDGIMSIKKLKSSGLRYKLYTQKGIPLLSLRGTQNAVGIASLTLCEYGEKRDYPPEYELFLREHTYYN